MVKASLEFRWRFIGRFILVAARIYLSPLPPFLFFSLLFLSPSHFTPVLIILTVYISSSYRASHLPSVRLAKPHPSGINLTPRTSRQGVGIINAGHMEFLPTPPSSPTDPKVSISQIKQATARLNRRMTKKALHDILGIGEGLQHDVVKTWTLDDLRHINLFFQTILRRSAYGVNSQVDKVINRLLLLAVDRCGELKTAQMPPSCGMLGWLSPSGAEIKDHLEVCRHMLGDILALHQNGLEDPVLDQIERTLQHLCPRITCMGYAEHHGKPSLPLPTQTTHRQRQSRKKAARAQSPPPPTTTSSSSISRPRQKPTVKRRTPPRLAAACKANPLIKQFPPPPPPPRAPPLLPTPPPTQIADTCLPDTLSSPTQLIHALVPVTPSYCRDIV
ncbi:hypothetical protein VTK26DRAFT_161 [Humicola hyalothermophila]